MKMKYALKALVEISQNKEGHISASRIAENTNIPLKFLEQILTELRKGDFVKSKKGSFGGYYLQKEPDHITLADIYRLIDGPIAWVPCASMNFYEACEDCPDELSCNIRYTMIYVRNETLKTLEKLTLADISNGRFNPY